MKKTKLPARLLVCLMTAVFCAWGGVISCADGSNIDNSPKVTYYTVTFVNDDGSVIETQQVKSGETATEPEVEPTKEDNSTFLGWYQDDKPFLFQNKITDNITLKAKWGEPGIAYHKVIFKDDDNNSELSVKVKDGETVPAPNDPKRDGYTFVGWYDESGDLFEFEKPISADIMLSARWDKIVSPGDSEGDTPKDKPTAEIPQNATVQIIENNGWLNSAYVIFKQIDGAVYEVTVDGTKIDEQLIRYYDEYVWYEPNEAADLSVKWEKKSHNKVVRADALGLKAGEHTIAVCAVGTNNSKTEPSTVKVTVIDHDRSGFAFTGTKTPGAYNKDGTLKSGAVVIYLTDKNKSTVKATLGGKEYTGIKNITQEIKSKNISTPVDIRVVGKVVATSSGKELSSKDLNSAWALGVKGASEVTIEGVGHDATLYGAGVAAFQSDYIEIANLGLMKWGGGKDGDGIALKGGGKDKSKGYIWVHNNDIFYGDAGSDGDQVKGDGSMDLKDDTKYVTIAYNHFWDSGKMSLCGMKSENGPNYITYHHNWFDHSDSRHPRIRTMTVHVYNNYFDGNAKYGVGVTTGASCFVEGNFFRNAHNPMMSSKQGTDAQGSGTFSGEKGGVIKSWNNAFEQKNTNGVKFQFITNKYDYTNNRALGEYKEEEKTLGTQTADGWVIYDSAITSSDDTIATNSLIAVEDASVKGAYYQTSKGKTCFFIDVPKNTTKIVIKAKTGSSTSGATTGIAIKDESEKTIASVGNIGNTAYEDFSFTVNGLTADSTLEIANTGSNSLNISGIKVIAESGWKTIVTSGADPTNIDAFEV
ncbi:MAG: InlB B-repeat-containing protein, partial [Treponemataceae bacterium]|nr:InlB B-repeat-containing protein [Treponemataceae bacterium]